MGQSSSVPERLAHVSSTSLSAVPTLCRAFAVVLIAISSPASLSAGQSRFPDDQELVDRLSRRADARILALQAEADELASRERSLLDEVRLLEIDRQIKTEELSAIDADLGEMTSRLEDAEARIAGLEAEVARQRPLIKARLVELYKLGAPGYARLLFGVDDLDRLGRTSRLVAALARRDHQRFEKHRETITQLETSRTTLADRRHEVAKMREGAQAARRRVDRAIASQTALVEELGTRRDLTAQLADELDRARQRLDAARATLAAGAAVELALPLTPFRGALDPPVSGAVRSGFGVARAAVAGVAPAGQGIELEAGSGESVHAVHGGQVVFAGETDQLGTLVVVDHGEGNQTFYGHLSSMAVREGTYVAPRGLVGTAGASADGAPTLYFELRVDGQPVNPVEWLK